MPANIPGTIARTAPVLDRVPVTTLLLSPGLYTLTGDRAKGTRRAIGVAVKIRELNNPSWFAGTALYRLDPGVRFFYDSALTEVQYVIVCNLPATPSNPKISLVFAANGHGNLYNDETDVRLVEIGPRLVGSNNHRRLLSALQGGYGLDLSKARPASKRDRSRKLDSVGHA